MLNAVKLCGAIITTQNLQIGLAIIERLECCSTIKSMHEPIPWPDAASETSANVVYILSRRLLIV